MKKLLSFILSLVLIMGILPTVNAETGGGEIPRDGLIGEFLLENGNENTSTGDLTIGLPSEYMGITNINEFPYKYAVGLISGDDCLTGSNNSIKSMSLWIKPVLMEDYASDFNNSSFFYKSNSSGTYLYIGYNYTTGKFVINGRDLSVVDKNKWHNIVIIRESGNYRAFIDGEKYSLGNEYYHFYHYRHRLVNAGKLRFYDRVLTDEEALTLANEKKADFNITKVNTDNGIISKSGDNYNVKIKIQDQFNIGENMEVSYAYDSDDYTVLKTIQTDENKQAESDLLVPYNDTANLLKIKVSDGTYEHEVIYNIDEEYRKNNISITGTLTPGKSYQFSASSQFGNVTGYSVTENNICGESLSFSDYVGTISYSDASYNGKQVCFKAVHGDNIVNYKVSSVMSGIAQATTPVTNSDLFGNYTNWKYSTSPKTFDPLYILLKELPTYTQSSSPSTSYPTMFNDINGDSLPDFLITKHKESGSSDYYRYTNYAIMLNKGNMNFEVVYRCTEVTQASTTSGYQVGYYGDCAK